MTSTVATRAQEPAKGDAATVPTLALARRNSTFMARWTAIEPKPRSYQHKVPNQYPSKLRKLPPDQQHYALLDAEEYWLEILADHFPPAWVSASEVLAHLATIIPMAAPCGTKPYIALKTALKKALDAGARAGWDNDANIRCPPVPLALLHAVKVNGSAQAGAGELPNKIADDLTAAHLGWLAQEPSTCVIPRCWRVWAIRHNYPHAAYIGQPPPAQPTTDPEPTQRTMVQSPVRQRSPSRHRSSARQEDRLNIKGIPRRFSVPHRVSPELGHNREVVDLDEYGHDYDGRLIEDDESFELWDASFRDEEWDQTHDERKPGFPSSEHAARTFRHAEDFRSPSPIAAFDDDQAESTLVDQEPSYSAHTQARRPPALATKTDQQANVFNIKTMDDVRKLLADLGSQEAIRCPTANEVLPYADNDVHEAFTTYTRYFSAKVKAAMKLTLGQILLASPLAKLVKQSNAMRRDLDYYRTEAESVRQELPEAISAVKDAHDREVSRLHSEIAGLKTAVNKTAQQQQRRTRMEAKPAGSARQSEYQITTRAAAARGARPSTINARGLGSRPNAVPGVATRARPLGINMMAIDPSRKRGAPQHYDPALPARKRPMTGSKLGNAKNVYASYFANDE
ncbi:uncharacterized protein B0I36DRAFT_338511 [Microdochium trichocladiopsis]|uniref:Uncharacterized protein n=1 Tax=Microdochium trichocladiopsis TaxID=1682393 RepID=A0A9P8XS78_9PEZI|nr:uncharacterized protein B0I36DRAFT_338511 [Microdochium trichocladiopsis]KAH7014291.1 hypothetical protein B0I36DRAFT_338511 [Microdochium trichocladiopsis]